MTEHENTLEAALSAASSATQSSALRVSFHSVLLAIAGEVPLKTASFTIVYIVGKVHRGANASSANITAVIKSNRSETTMDHGANVVASKTDNISVYEMFVYPRDSYEL